MLPWGAALHAEGTRASLWHLQIPLIWSSGLAACRERQPHIRHWDLLQVFKDPQLNLVLQTVLFLTHKGWKTREKPCSSLPRSVLNSCLLLLNLREFKHFSYQIILKLVRHQVHSTANTALSGITSGDKRNVCTMQLPLLKPTRLTEEFWGAQNEKECVVSLMTNSGKSAKVH